MKHLKPSNNNLSQFEMRFTASLVFIMMFFNSILTYIGTEAVKENTKARYENTKSNYEMIKDRKQFIDKIEVLNKELESFKHH
jgi:hypothetical protein